MCLMRRDIFIWVAGHLVLSLSYISLYMYICMHYERCRIGGSSNAKTVRYHYSLYMCVHSYTEMYMLWNRCQSRRLRVQTFSVTVFSMGKFNWFTGIFITKRCISLCGERSYRLRDAHTRKSHDCNELNSIECNCGRREQLHTIISTMISPY